MSPPLLAVTTADDAGQAQLELPVPVSSGLHGASFAARAAGLDALGPFGQWALTSGLAVTID